MGHDHGWFGAGSRLSQEGKDFSSSGVAKTPHASFPVQTQSQQYQQIYASKRAGVRDLLEAMWPLGRIQMVLFISLGLSGSPPLPVCSAHSVGSLRCSGWHGIGLGPIALQT